VILERALIVHKPWANMIVSGEKKWELRSRRRKIRDRVGIIEAGSAEIIGAATLVDCIDVASSQVGSLSRWFGLHRVPTEKLSRYLIRYAWCFEDAEIFKPGIPYHHPKGAQVWVKL
jgi:hypothetical protein